MVPCHLQCQQLLVMSPMKLMLNGVEDILLTGYLQAPVVMIAIPMEVQ